MKDDLYFMQEALLQAEIAQYQGEIPVGAVLTFNNEIVSRAHNTSIRSGDPSAHAEVNVIRDAAKKLNNYRLKGTSLYVTLEPCIMCCGLLIHSRIENLIFSATDPKSGFVISNSNFLGSEFLNHKVKFRQGPLIQESSNLLKCFFRERRL